MPYRIEKNVFTATLLDDSFLADAIENGKLSGQVKKNSAPESFLTATSDELQAFFLKERDRIFDKHTVSGNRKPVQKETSKE